MTTAQERAYAAYIESFDPSPIEQWEGYRSPLSFEDWCNR